MAKQGEAGAQYSSLSADSPLLSPRNLNYGQNSALGSRWKTLWELVFEEIKEPKEVT